MKTRCDFCKTEYSLDYAPSAPVQCALCGNTWTVLAPNRRNSFLVFTAALCALLAAGIFAFVVIANHQTHRNVKKNPLLAQISKIDTITDDAGVAHFVVNGKITNQTAEIYGVPDLIIVSRDDTGAVVATQKFMPSATLLDAGQVATFSHTLSAPTTNIKKISVELKQGIGNKE